MSENEPTAPEPEPEPATGTVPAVPPEGEEGTPE